MVSLSTHINFEKYPSTNYTERRNGGYPKIVVMHYTACPLDEALNTLTSKVSNASVHYLVSAEGKTVYSLVDEDKRSWHAGNGYWRGIDDVNSYSIGIENVNWGYTYGPVESSNPLLQKTWMQGIHFRRRLGENGFFPSAKKTWHPFPQEQMNTLALLSKRIIDTWSIEPENVIGHADLASGRKTDPGPLFPWKVLAKKGVGVWYNPDTDRIHSNKPLGVSVSWMQKNLEKWGYKVPQNGSLDPETKKAVQAFQMHFRPEKYTGIIDEESMEILDTLLCQRDNKLDL